MTAPPRRRGVVAPEIRARDQGFWPRLLDARAVQPEGLPPPKGAGPGNRRFTLIPHAAWVTLFREGDAVPEIGIPAPHIGVFLRCARPAGHAFFAQVNRARAQIEPRLKAGIGPGAKLQWGISRVAGTIDVRADLVAPLPWDDTAAGAHIAWLLRTGALWWSALAPLAATAMPHDDTTAPAAAPPSPPSLRITAAPSWRRRARLHHR